VLQHPVLQVGIKDSHSKRPAWVQLDQVDLGNHVEWCFLEKTINVEEFLQEKIASQVDTDFAPLQTQSGWRMLLICQEEAMFLDAVYTWNHPHADGMSGRIYHEDLLQCLNKQTETEFTDVSSDIINLPTLPPMLPPPVEKLSSLSMGPGFVMKTLWDSLKPVVFNNSPSQARWAPIRPLPFKTCIRTLVLKSHVVDNVISACRQHKCTLTSLLHGLAAVSFALLVKDAVAFQAGTPINVRRFLHSGRPEHAWLQPERTMANYVTMTSHEFDASLVASIRNTNSSLGLLEKVWVVSGRVRQEIDNKLKCGLKNDEICLGRFVGDYQKYMREKARRPRKFSWTITNLGVLDTSLHPGLWSISRAQFTLSAEIPSAAVMISPISVRSGELCIACSWQDTVVDSNLVDRLMTDFDRNLRQIESAADQRSKP
jgi:hypothetical protein